MHRCHNDRWHSRIGHISPIAFDMRLATQTAQAAWSARLLTAGNLRKLSSWCH
jgi:hypothetical protein